MKIGGGAIGGRKGTGKCGVKGWGAKSESIERQVLMKISHCIFIYLAFYYLFLFCYLLLGSLTETKLKKDVQICRKKFRKLYGRFT